MRRAEISPRGAVDLEEIWLFVAENSVASADRLLSAIHERCRRLAQSPRMGRPRPELSHALRSYPVGNYVIFYRPTRGGIEVVRVLSGYRDLPGIFKP